MRIAGFFRLAVVSTQVDSVIRKVSRAWLKEQGLGISTPKYFFLFMRKLYLIENDVQFHCLSSYRNDLYRNDFVSKRLVSFSSTVSSKSVSSKREGAATPRLVVTDVIINHH